MLRAYLTEAKYESLRMLRSPAFGLPLLLLPIVFYLFFAVVVFGPIKDPRIAIGVFTGFAVLGVMGPAMFGFGAVLALERDQGLLTFKRALPMPPAANLLARMLMAMLFGAITTPAMLAAALSLGHVPLSFWQCLRFAAVNILGVLPFCAIGLFLGTLIKGQAAPAIANLVYLAMAYLGGLFFPMPKSMLAVQLASPAYHLSQIALKAAGAVSQGATFIHLAVLASVTMIFTLLAIRRLARVG